MGTAGHEPLPQNVRAIRVLPSRTAAGTRSPRCTGRSTDGRPRKVRTTTMREPGEATFECPGQPVADASSTIDPVPSATFPRMALILVQTVDDGNRFRADRARTPATFARLSSRSSTECDVLDRHFASVSASNAIGITSGTARGQHRCRLTSVWRARTSKSSSWASTGVFARIATAPIRQSIRRRTVSPPLRHRR